MDTCLNEIVRYLLAQSWQIALLAVAVAAVTFALRNRSAHVRYLLWLLVLAKCLVPPFYAVPLHILPSAVPGGTPDSRLLSEWLAGHSGAPPQALPEESPIAVGESVPPPRALPADERRLSASGWLAIIWILGAGAYLTRNLLRAWRGCSWLRKSRRRLSDDVQSDIADTLLAYGVKRLPKIWIVEGVGQPFVWGLLRGSIYVPPGFLSLESHEHRRDVLAHELSHILRFDAAVNVLQVAAQGMFWFHPLVWWANREIRRERERCCNEMVLALGTCTVTAIEHPWFQGFPIERQQSKPLTLRADEKAVLDFDLRSPRG